MITRQKLLTLKKQLRALHPVDTNQAQVMHTLIDANLEMLDLLDGGTTAANRTAEVRKGLADVRAVLNEILDNVPADLEPAVVDGAPLITDVSKALLMLNIIDREMLSSDYRRYPAWADQQPRIAEEFS